MNENNEKQAAEKISAYLDDALSADEVNALISEHQAAEHVDNNFSIAARYQLVGEALRGELSDASMVDISTQVSEALQNEPSHIAEPVKAVETSSSSGQFGLFAWLEPLFRPLAGVAVAASVAALMVVTVVQLESPAGGQQLANSPAAVPATLIANKLPADNALTKQQRAAEFDEYLAEHAEFAAQDTLQGRLPYVRAVSYEAE
ncbi:MAG: sigma-E factor negative regulatory protein [Gammaproteobacteria bacterium]|nr:sigma-E factor negative regulatory protein [Gammaproteobacteria bacterium]MCW8923385.1 sigma-E factor negative regulatory protein [Gammaproteobacteria bacterium]